MTDARHVLWGQCVIPFWAERGPTFQSLPWIQVWVEIGLLILAEMKQ